eukprot:m.60851 g.60851  ORF g.60851 m.60851 type:complete len:61 (+) comp11356_c0_seq4:40-222(+)
MQTKSERRVRSKDKEKRRRKESASEKKLVRDVSDERPEGNKTVTAHENQSTQLQIRKIMF